VAGIEINLTVNGREYRVEVEPSTRLIDLLRDELGLTGTKEGCGKGECGTCTVIMDGKTVNSCLILAPQAHKSDIITIEGIGSRQKPHPLQRAFVEEGAVQCGYCTPGLILSSYFLLKENPNPGIEEIQEGISGNLCRCTGYTKVIEAVKKVAEGREKGEE